MIKVRKKKEKNMKDELYKLAEKISLAKKRKRRL